MQRYCSDAANIAQARRRTILTKSRTKINGMHCQTDLHCAGPEARSFRLPASSTAGSVFWLPDLGCIAPDPSADLSFALSRATRAVGP